MRFNPHEIRLNTKLGGGRGEGWGSGGSVVAHQIYQIYHWHSGWHIRCTTDTEGWYIRYIRYTNDTYQIYHWQISDIPLTHIIYPPNTYLIFHWATNRFYMKWDWTLKSKNLENLVRHQGVYNFTQDVKWLFMKYEMTWFAYYARWLISGITRNDSPKWFFTL